MTPEQYAIVKSTVREHMDRRISRIKLPVRYVTMEDIKMSEEVSKRTRIAKPKSAQRLAVDIMDWLSESDHREVEAKARAVSSVEKRFALQRAAKVQGLDEEVQNALHALQGITGDE